MKRDVPAPTYEKLLALSDAAETLSAQVARTEEGIRDLRYRMTAAKDQEQYDALRRSLEQMVAALPTLKRRCDDAQSTYSECRAWLDSLPPDTTLEPVKPKLDGHTLDAVRARIAALDEERIAIEGSGPTLEELAADIRSQVNALAAAPTALLGGQREVHSRALTSVKVASDASLALIVKLLGADRVIPALLIELETRVTAAQRVPRAKRTARLAAIEREVTELAYVEENLVEKALARGETVERRNGAPVEAILQVRIVTKKARAA